METVKYKMVKKLKTRGDKGREKAKVSVQFASLNLGLQATPSCAPSASPTSERGRLCAQALCVHVFIRSHDPSGALSTTSQPTSQHLIGLLLPHLSLSLDHTHQETAWARSENRKESIQTPACCFGCC